VFYLRHVFDTASALDSIFTFREDFAKRTDLAWQHEQFDLVTVVTPANKNDLQISVLTPSSGCSSNVGFTAKSGEDVAQWISTNSDRYTFCLPPENFGPDILFFIQSKRSQQLLLVVVQAKRYEKVPRQVLIKGVRTVTPSWFWKSKNTNHATADAAPLLVGDKVAMSTQNALENIPRGLPVQGADYPVLRVVASWPGEAQLERSKEGDVEDTDHHPLAALRLDAFKGVCDTLSSQWFRGIPEKRGVKRTPGEDPEAQHTPKRTKREC